LLAAASRRRISGSTPSPLKVEPEKVAEARTEGVGGWQAWTDLARDGRKAAGRTPGWLDSRAAD